MFIMEGKPNDKLKDCREKWKENLITSPRIVEKNGLSDTHNSWF